MLLLQSLYFSRPPPHQSYNPRHPPPFPLGTFENQDVAVTVRRGISKRSHEKIGDCEQSNSRLFMLLSATVKAEVTPL